MTSSQLQLVGLPKKKPTTTESDEAYTIDSDAYPVIRLVTDFFGGIGLDPTANPQKTIPARHHMTKADNSLDKSWKGKGGVYMNPPYSCADVFVQKMVEEYLQGHVPGAISLLLSTTVCSKKTGPLVQETASAQCWIHGRLRFRYGTEARMGIIGEPLTVPSVLTYWGPEVEKFNRLFTELGTCVSIAKTLQIPTRLGQVQKALLCLIRRHGANSQKVYAELLGCSPSAVSHAMRSLRARALIAGVPARLTQEGLRVAAAINRSQE